MRGILNDPGSAAAVVTILVERLGGKVVITQEDFDAVVGYGLDEDVTDTITFTVEKGTHNDNSSPSIP
jgi:hypothetical protein